MRTPNKILRGEAADTLGKQIHEISKKWVLVNTNGKVRKGLQHDTSVIKCIKRFYHGSSKKIKTGANGYKTFIMDEIRNDVAFGFNRGIDWFENRA